MTKRTKLVLLIIVGLILLLLGLWFFLQPLLRAQPAAQPPALPKTVTQYAPPGQVVPTVKVTSTTPLVPAQPVDTQLGVLENLAATTVSRIGSGVNDDGFVQYQDVLSSFTADGQAKLLAQQKTLQQQHPASGAAYGITTVTISSHAISGKTGDATILVSVEAVQRVDSGNPNKPMASTPKQVTVTFTKQANRSYLISDMVWTDEKI